MKLIHIITIVFILACFSFSVKQVWAQESIDEKHIQVSLRMIGHQVMLNAGDSTSRILPIIKENDKYEIQFESPFAFEPAQLVATVNQIVLETDLADSYIVEVVRCDSKDVVYSYEMNKAAHSNIVPCASRTQPQGCFNLAITLFGAERSNDIALLEETQTGFIQQNLGRISLLAILLLGVVAFVWNKRSPSQDSNLIPLGDYLFDKRNTELLFDQQRIELTGKEADLLNLLYGAVNTTIERDVILRSVWGDQGGYVGRTLDVFISKLRKKLEADPKVKIVNIRGVGYKLVLDV